MTAARSSQMWTWCNSLHGTATSPTYSSTSRWVGNKYLCSTWLEFNPEVPEKCKVHTLALESLAVHTF